MAAGYNSIGSREKIDQIVDEVRNCAFFEERVDLTQCFRREKNREFIYRYRYTARDIRDLLSSVRTEDYCYTSHESGEEDAYVFSPDAEMDLQLFLKIQIVDGVVVLSLHEAERNLSFPYRRR